MRLPLSGPRGYMPSWVGNYPFSESSKSSYHRIGDPWLLLSREPDSRDGRIVRISIRKEREQRLRFMPYYGGGFWKHPVQICSLQTVQSEMVEHLQK